MDPALEQKGEDACQKQCQQFACAIQSCLSKNSYKQQPCQKIIAQYNFCCSQAKERVYKAAAVARRNK